MILEIILVYVAVIDYSLGPMTSPFMGTWLDLQ